MLINFSLENYLSFKGENTFSLEPGNRLRKYSKTHIMNVEGKKVLKNAIIFGPNGSGKSNLIVGLSVFRNLVVKPTKNIKSQLGVLPFLLDNKSIVKPTVFKAEFISNSQRYLYILGVTRKKVIIEELYVFEKNKYVSYFIREENTYHDAPDNREQLINDTRPNSLFLYSLQDKNDYHAIQVFNWFNESLIFEDNINPQHYYELLEDKNLKNIFLSFLKFTDFNIIDVEIKTNINTKDEESEENLNPINKELYTVYKEFNSEGEVIDKVSLPLGLESAGTRKMIRIALAIIASQEGENKILIFDEFNNHFHLNLSLALIKIFNSLNNKNQFILTTHELQLLNCEIRKDQIYFVSKDFDGESNLYSLFDFVELNARDDISFVKRYLEGQFGAVPQVDVDKILELFS